MPTGGPLVPVEVLLPPPQGRPHASEEHPAAHQDHHRDHRDDDKCGAIHHVPSRLPSYELPGRPTTSLASAASLRGSAAGPQATLNSCCLSFRPFSSASPASLKRRSPEGATSCSTSDDTRISPPCA